MHATEDSDVRAHADLPIDLSVCLSLCLSVSLSVCMSVCYGSVFLRPNPFGLCVHTCVVCSFLLLHAFLAVSVDFFVTFLVAPRRPHPRCGTAWALSLRVEWLDGWVHVIIRPPHSLEQGPS